MKEKNGYEGKVKICIEYHHTCTNPEGVGGSHGKEQEGTIRTRYRRVVCKQDRVTM